MYPCVLALNNNKLTLAWAPLFPFKGLLWPSENATWITAGCALFKEALLPRVSLACYPRKLCTASLWSLNKNEVGICISPLIELAQPDVGLHSQKHRQACFQACNGDGGRQAVCPASLQSMALDMCHWYPLKPRLQNFPSSTHKSRDGLCKMPYFWCQLDPVQMSVEIRKCFLKGEWSIMDKMICNTRCLKWFPYWIFKLNIFALLESFFLREA